jgi:osmotically-inducible protein OsmY
MKGLHKALLLCLLPLSLSGCVAAVLVAGVGAGVATKNVVSDRRGIHQEFKDRKTTDLAKSLVVHTPYLRRNSHLTIATYNGIVLLAGQAQSEEVKQGIENLIRQKVPNIHKIYNELVVSGKQSSLASVNDSWLETKIHSAMTVRRGLISNDIKVIAVDGTIYLMGKVSAQQAQLAADTARRVNGVRKVIEVFEIHN